MRGPARGEARHDVPARREPARRAACVLRHDRSAHPARAGPGGTLARGRHGPRSRRRGGGADRGHPGRGCPRRARPAPRRDRRAGARPRSQPALARTDNRQPSARLTGRRGGHRRAHGNDAVPSLRRARSVDGSEPELGGLRLSGSRQPGAGRVQADRARGARRRIGSRVRRLRGRVGLGRSGGRGHPRQAGRECDRARGRGLLQRVRLFAARTEGLPGGAARPRPPTATSRCRPARRSEGAP
jgi:hypothetical protein